jgi:hypothetical protein
VYSGHYPRIFVAPKNAQNAETKRRLGAVPILLLALSASTTSAYTSLGVSQELNPQPQLLKELVLLLSHISWQVEVARSNEELDVLEAKLGFVVIGILPRPMKEEESQNDHIGCCLVKKVTHRR